MAFDQGLHCLPYINILDTSRGSRIYFQILGQDIVFPILGFIRYYLVILWVYMVMTFFFFYMLQQILFIYYFFNI